MTFDEAAKKVKLLGEQGADTWWGPQLEEHTHVRGHLEQGDIELLVYQLRKTYAPNIEMTKAEKDLFMRQMKVIKEEGKRVNNFEYFVNALTFSNDLHDNALDRLLDEYQTDSKQLMLAWLNPELIKVVD